MQNEALLYLQTYYQQTGQAQLAQVQAELEQRRAEIKHEVEQDALFGQLDLNISVLLQYWQRSVTDCHHNFRNYPLEMAYLVHKWYDGNAKSFAMWLCCRLETLCKQDSKRLNILPNQVGIHCFPLLSAMGQHCRTSVEMLPWFY